MKFYKDKINGNHSYWNKIIINKLNAIYCSSFSVHFYKNGMKHNTKNPAYIRFDRYKTFYLNDKSYGNQDKFTKKSWRKFIKLQVFL
jgi:predicted phosphohydrolase